MRPSELDRTPAGVVLVEGESDRNALLTLARRWRRNLESEHVTIVPMGGATNIATYLRMYGGSSVRLAGLCDLGEEEDFRDALERAGLGSDLTRSDMEALGFFVCEKDLESELIRALGPARVVSVIEAAGELERFRVFQRQPAQRERSIEYQLWRFMGTHAGRKARYASLLVEALDLSNVPRPMEGVLQHV